MPRNDNELCLALSCTHTHGPVWQYVVSRFVMYVCPSNACRPHGNRELCSSATLSTRCIISSCRQKQKKNVVPLYFQFAGFYTAGYVPLTLTQFAHRSEIRKHVQNMIRRHPDCTRSAPDLRVSGSPIFMFFRRFVTYFAVSFQIPALTPQSILCPPRGLDISDGNSCENN